MLLKKNSATNNPTRDRIVVHPAYCHRFASLQKPPWFPGTSGTSHFERIWIQEKEWIAMASAAQIEANRRNSKKSCGPRTQAGKDKSRFNAPGPRLPGEYPGPADRGVRRL